MYINASMLQEVQVVHSRSVGIGSINIVISGLTSCCSLLLHALHSLPCCCGLFLSQVHHEQLNVLTCNPLHQLTGQQMAALITACGTHAFWSKPTLVLAQQGSAKAATAAAAAAGGTGGAASPSHPLSVLHHPPALPPASCQTAKGKI